MKTYIDAKSAIVGDPDLINWINVHGVEANHCRRVDREVEDGKTMLTFHVMQIDNVGRYVLNEAGDDIVIDLKTATEVFPPTDTVLSHFHPA